MPSIMTAFAQVRVSLPTRRVDRRTGPNPHESPSFHALPGDRQRIHIPPNIYERGAAEG